VPEKDTPEFEIRTAAEAGMIRMLELRASQGGRAPTGQEGVYGGGDRAGGGRQAGETSAGAGRRRGVGGVKGAAKLDVADRRRKLTGDVLIERESDKLRVRLTSSGTQAGMRLAMVADPEKAVRRKAADLGLLEVQMAELKAIVDDAKGVVLL